MTYLTVTFSENDVLLFKECVGDITEPSAITKTPSLLKSKKNFFPKSKHDMSKKDIKNLIDEYYVDVEFYNDLKKQ